MPLGPTAQPPLLHDLGRFLQRDIRARYIAAEEGEFASRLRTLVDGGRGAHEGRESIGGGEGGVEFLGCGAEFLAAGDRDGVHVRGAVARCLLRRRSGGGRGGGLADAGGGGDFAFGELWDRARGVLEVLAVLGDEGGAELGELLAQLRGDLGADEVLDGLLGGAVGVDLYLKLVEREREKLMLAYGLKNGWGRVFGGRAKVDIRRTHLPRCRGRPLEW